MRHSASPPREYPDARAQWLTALLVLRLPNNGKRAGRVARYSPVHAACVHTYDARQPANARCRPRLMRHLLCAPGTKVRSVLRSVTMSTRAKAPTCWVCGLEERAHFDSKNMAFIWGLYRVLMGSATRRVRLPACVLDSRRASVGVPRGLWSARGEFTHTAAERSLRSLWAVDCSGHTDGDTTASRRPGDQIFANMHTDYAPASSVGSPRPIHA